MGLIFRSGGEARYHFMSYYIPVILCVIPALLLFVIFVAVPLYRMERRGRALLAAHPGAEQTSVYLELHSAFAWGKQREIDAKIAQMQSLGWTFLRASEANPSRTLRSLGGGLTLRFIRAKADGRQT